MQLCCVDVKAKLRNVVTISIDVELFSGAYKMCYKNAPPRSIYAKREKDAALELCGVSTKKKRSDLPLRPSTARLHSLHTEQAFTHREDIALLNLSSPVPKQPIITGSHSIPCEPVMIGYFGVRHVEKFQP